MQAKQTRDWDWLGSSREWGECGAGYVLRWNERFFFALHDWSCKAKCWNQELPEEPGMVFKWKIRGEQRFAFYTEWWWTIFFPRLPKDTKKAIIWTSLLVPECCFRRNVCLCVCACVPACVPEWVGSCVFVCLCTCASLQYTGHKWVVTFLGRSIWDFGLLGQDF